VPNCTDPNEKQHPPRSLKSIAWKAGLPRSLRRLWPAAVIPKAPRNLPDCPTAPCAGREPCCISRRLRQPLRQAAPAAVTFMVYYIFEFEPELHFVNDTYLGCLRQCPPAALNGTNSTPSRTATGLGTVDNDSRECLFASLVPFIILVAESSFNEILSSGGSVSIVAAFELPSTFPYIRLHCNFTIRRKILLPSSR
jgi:hypothetical protein